MNSVYILHHIHEFEDGHEDHKIIGVFATEAEAKEALECVKDQSGFKQSPDGFDVAEWKLGQIGWREGYVTIQPGE